jgi:hypothetical protein
MVLVRQPPDSCQVMLLHHINLHSTTKITNHNSSTASLIAGTPGQYSSPVISRILLPELHHVHAVQAVQANNDKPASPATYTACLPVLQTPVAASLAARIRLSCAKRDDC